MRPRRGGSLRRWLAGAALVLVGSAALAADPQITQFSDRPDPVPAGSNVTYTARIENDTLDAATNVRVSVPVPAGTTFVSATAPCALVGVEVVCDLGTMGSNNTDERVLDFVFRALGPGTTTVRATATLSGSNDSNSANNVQSQTTTVTEGSDLSLSKTDAPDPVVGGANVTYTLTPSNAGPNAARDIVLTDNLPPSASFVSASGAGWACSHAAGVVTCTHPGPHAPGAAIAPVSIVARVEAPGGTVTNTASVAPGPGGTSDPDGGNNTATADTAVLPGADVNVARKVVVSGNPARSGSNVTFRIEPRNGGPVTATDVVVTDTLPAVPAGAAGWGLVSVAGPNWACSSTGTTARCTRATLAAGTADDITLVATAPPAATVGTTGTTYTNTAAISASSTDPSPGNNTGSAQVTVLPDGADLRIAMSKTPTRVARGAEATAALSITNNGPLVATGRLRVVDQLSAGETYVSSAGTDWSCTPNGRTVVCDYANPGGLGVGVTAPVLTVVSQVTATGALLNTACTGSTVPSGAAAGTTASPPAEGDYNAGNDCTTVLSTGTAGGPDLAITKTTSTPAGGDKVVSINEASVTYTLRVTNVTAAPAVDGASGVRITDSIPATVAGTAIASPVATVSPGSTASFNCTVASATVTCTQSGGVLLPGATVTVPITVGRPLAAGTYTNTATVTNTVEGDSNSGNNSASDTVTIEGIADIDLTGKTVSPQAVRAGERATYVVSYRNNGPSEASSVTLSDTFAFPAGDPGFTVVSIASTKPGSTCSIGAGAQLTAAAPVYTCSLGNLAGGEAQSVTLVVSPNFQTGNPTRNVVNTAVVATATPESPGGGDNGNNRRSVTLEVDPARVDLLTNKVDVQDPVPFAGSAFLDYRVTVTSNTVAAATGVRIEEVMTPPAGRRVRFVCDTAGAGSATCNAPSLCSATGITSAPGAALSFSCALPAGTAASGAAQGSLAPMQSKTVFLRFQALDSPSPTGDIYRNVATAVANEPDSFPGNDAADEQTSVRQRIDLAVAKTASAATVALRQPFTWTVRVTNNGPGNAVQTDLADTLPAGAVLTGPVAWTKTAPSGTGNCTATGSVVSCALGRLDAGGVATIELPVRFETFPAGGSAANTAVVDTDMTKIGGADPVPGNDSATSTVTVTRSSLAGTVFDDRDRAGGNAGTPQPGEPRIAGVAVRLSGTDANGNPVDLTTTTDAAGNYVFADLAPSDGAGYTVSAAQPAGFGNSPAAPPAPSAGGTYMAAAAGGGSAFTGVVLGAGVAASGYHFPELRQASLGGSVYVDRNGNGVRDAGVDEAVPGASVRLLDASTGALVAGVTTGAAGDYVFTGLDAARAYTLEQPLPASPAGLQNGPVNPGRVGGAPCAAGCTAQPDTPVPGTDRIAFIDLAAGDGSGFDFGERQRAGIAGIVYIDADRDNALTATDTGRIAGVVVRLVQGADCGSGTTLQTQTTGADGAYRFDAIAALQDYLVCQTQPAGYGNGNAKGTPGSNSIAVAALPAAGSLDNHFGETVAAISGSVYQDGGAGNPANADNGVRDAGEAGIAGVTVTLTGRDITGAAVNPSVVTDPQGNFRFDGLLQSDAAGYALVEGPIPPAAGSFGDGRETAGSAGGSIAANDRIAGIVLGAGVQATGYLFGELPLAAVTGTVYLDRNRNGAPDAAPADGRLAGVTVTLRAGGSCSGAVVATATTDAAGAYALSGGTVGLPYTVCQTQPAGYADGAANAGAGASVVDANTLAIAALPAGGSAGNHFGERAASLAGSVFLDGNNDGVRNGSDSGIAGVTVTLSGTDAAGSAVSRPATTDASGAWRFDDLLAAGAGGYTVTEQAAQPVVGGAATLDGRTTAGTAGGTATPPGTTPSAVSGVALAAGADATGYAFAEIAAATIAGVVFTDTDDDGVRGAGEAGIGGVAIVVTGTDDLGAAVTRSATTAADGTWSVTGLRPGTYTVTEPTQPAGTSNGMTVAGTAGGTPTPRATTPSAVTGIVLAPGATAGGYAFAERAASAGIAGRVWLDLDNDGVVDPGEAGIAGVTVELTGTDSAGGAVSRSAVTDPQGDYTLAGLLPGTYAVRQPVQPPGTLDGRTAPGGSGGTATAPGTTPSAVTGIALAAGQGVTGVAFGELPPASVAGRVFIDSDGNGRSDAGEPGLAGVTLRLAGTDDLGATVAATVTTDGAGAYAFASLRPGTYTITEPDQPPGTTDGATRAGSAGGTATPVGTLPSAVSGIVLAAGVASSGNDFAESGSSPDLLASVTSVEPRFTVNSTGSYTIRVRNAGSAPTSAGYTVNGRLPSGIALAAPPTGSGWTCTGAAGGQLFACTSSEPLAPGQANPNPITLRVSITEPALAASPASNAVLVEGGGEVPARAPSAAERDAFANNPGALPLCSAAIAQNACRSATPVQAAASVSGTVWLDGGTTRGTLDGGDRRLGGWIVEVVDPASAAVVGRATSDRDNGTWRIADLPPGVPLAVRFRDPQSGIVWAYPVNGESGPGSSGAACEPAVAQAGGGFSSCTAGGADASLGVVLAAGRNLPQQSLPVDPSVVYDSATRQAVGGATVSLAPAGSCPGWDPATGIVAATLGGYTINGGTISMNAGADGRFQFVLSPAAPARCDFALAVAAPPGYAFPSTLIPPAAGTFVPPGAPGSAYAVQPQAGPPSGAAGAATTYHLVYAAGSALPRLVHNHVPLDTALPAGLALQKTGDRAQAEIGDTVRYTVTVQRGGGGTAAAQTTVVDRLPAGFTYIPGTATVDGRPIADPAGGPGPRLTFQLGPTTQASGQLVLQYRLRIGVGAQQGDGENRARAYACTTSASCVGADGATPLAGAAASNEGRHRVRLAGGVFTTEACVLGKIFVDCNGNHVQDAEEIGIPGVRLLFSDGTFLVSDSEGKYSYCGLPPRGHVLKVDAWTLPRGSRLTTTSNRNLGDAGSLWLDLKNGELHRADFAEGSCSNTVLDQVKARRAQGGVRSVETERPRGPALRFESKAHGLGGAGAPRQATDSADQPVPKPRDAGAAPARGATDAAR